MRQSVSTPLGPIVQDWHAGPRGVVSVAELDPDMCDHCEADYVDEIDALEALEDAAPTLTEALEARGFTHRRSSTSRNQYAHDVLDGAGRVLLTGTAAQVWHWLASR